MIPCVGAGITVPDPKKGVGWRHQTCRLRRAYVVSADRELNWSPVKGVGIVWRSGSVQGKVWENDEGVEWIHGHGPQARAALLVARGLG